MKIGLQTWGSDGDIRPFIALAGGLSARGHRVTLAITSVEMNDYTAYGDSLKFEIISAHDTYGKAGKDALLGVKRRIMNEPPINQLKSICDELLEPAVDEMYETARQLCSGNDAVIGHLVLHPVQLAALKRGCPYGTVVFSPDIFPSRHRAPTRLPDLGGWMNPWWWRLAGTMTNRMFLRHANRLRHREGCSAASDLVSDVWESKRLTLIAASPTLFDRPPDWNGHLQMCGFFGVPEEAEQWTMPKDLRRFIGEGEPPIYMTFGSMTPITLLETRDLFVDAVRAAGCRAIIQLPWDTMSNVVEYPNIYRIDKVPHDKVLPYCSLVVHHGGAGTAHSASLSGCPSVIIEHLGDQIFWGTQLRRLGLASRVLHKRSVTAKALAAEIRRVSSSSAMKQRARKISESMKKEDGVKRAVGLVEEHLLN